jgi:hypothetical protein
MADEIELAHLPTGQMVWRALVEHVCNADVTAERHYLEVKSDVDLRTDKGRSKVAKFILGAANRDPVEAAPYFDGYALLFLGVGVGVTPGLEPFEVKDLKQFVQKFTGNPGPTWDFQSVEVDDGRSVIIVVVSPPNAETQPWVCEGQGQHEKLANGRIYIRADGETREAKAPEINAMTARSKIAAKPVVELDVEMLGEVRSYVYDDNVFEEYIANQRTRLLEALPAPDQGRVLSRSELNHLGIDTRGIKAAMDAVSVTQAALSGWIQTSPETRTEDQYRAQIEEWDASVRAAIPAALDKMAASSWPCVAFRVLNKTKAYLEEPEFQLHIEGPVEAMDKEYELKNFLDELPRPPRLWGPISTSPLASFLSSGIPSPVMPYFPAGGFQKHGVVRYKNGGSVDLTFSMGELRPLQDVTLDDDDFVLVLRGPDASGVRGTWHATVRGHNDRYEGTFDVRVREPVVVSASWLRRQLQLDSDDEADGEDLQDD